jgi:hypothetical protein
MPEPARLNVGDPYFCPPCRTPHVIANRTATERRRNGRVVCHGRGAHYCVGVAPRGEDRSSADG